MDLPPIRAGEDARLVAAEHRGALVAANRRLADGRDWYACVRESYQGRAACK